MALAFVLVLGSSPARATFFTIDSILIINAATPGNTAPIRGRIRPVTDGSGTFLLTDGVVDFGSQDYVLFDVTLLGTSSASIEALSASVNTTLGNDILGVGAFDDAGRQAPAGVTHEILVEGDFDFSGANTIGPTETSVRLFLTYPDVGDLGNLAIGQTIDFTIDPTGAAAPFTVSGVLIPEPATLALLAGALLALGARRTGRAAR